MAIDALLSRTPPEWAPMAVARFDEVLVDHAHCEKKAAAHALALIAQYPQASVIIEPLAVLAQEELRHFRSVVKILFRRGGALTLDRGDPYVKELLRHCRHGEPDRLVDRLLMAAVVEARSAERLQLLADALAVGDLKDFYAALALAEAGHHRLFVRLAGKVVGRTEASCRHLQWLHVERSVSDQMPLLPRIH